MLHLAIDIGNSRTSAAIFEEDTLLDLFAELTSSFPSETFHSFLHKHSIGSAMISSVHRQAGERAAAALKNAPFPILNLTPDMSSIQLSVDEPQAVGTDRIANFYGALNAFPSNNCIVIDVGTAITVDSIAANGVYLGGSIFPGFGACVQGLSASTDLLKIVEVVKPSDAIGKTTKTQIQSGIYYGILGAIERLVAETVHSSSAPGSIKILATGGYIDPAHPLNRDGIADDLMDLVDLFEPNLTLIGLNQILKEKQRR